jgi:hypothetical protein
MNQIKLHNILNKNLDINLIIKTHLINFLKDYLIYIYEND